MGKRRSAWAGRESEIVADYRGGEPVVVIRTRYGICLSSLYELLDHHRVPRRLVHEHRSW